MDIRDTLLLLLLQGAVALTTAFIVVIRKLCMVIN